MRHIFITGIIIVFGAIAPLFAQQYKAVIPYRIVGGKMIVEMSVNGKMRSFVFDTGGRTALTAPACEALQLTVTDSIKVTDVNSKDNYYRMTRIENLTTPDKGINFTNVPSLIINEVNGWKCFGTEGIIGSDLFAHMIITIDSEKQNITVTSAEKPSTVSLRKMQGFVKNSSIPIVQMQITPVSNLPVLFDTGSPSLLSLKQSDFEQLKQEVSLDVLSEGYGEGNVGVGGQAAKASSYRVRIPLISLGPTKFRNIKTTTNTHPYTLLGVKLLEYGKVTIDYPRKRFYFESFQPENEINDQFHNFNLTVKEGDLLVSTVWSSTKGKVEVGDKVIKINGKPVRKYDFCESILTGIPELKVKKQSKLTLRTASGEEKDIVYKKE